jgi:hypothetical protein
VDVPYKGAEKTKVMVAYEEALLNQEKIIFLNTDKIIQFFLLLFNVIRHNICMAVHLAIVEQIKCKDNF